MSRTEVLRLYREILRNLKRLPPETRDYYHYYAKSEILAYVDEKDPKIIELSIKKGYDYMNWVLNKYLGPQNVKPNKQTEK